MAIAVGAPPAQITAPALTTEERDAADRLLADLTRYRRPNLIADAYYTGRRRVRDLGIAVPPDLKDMLYGVVGWPATVVDVLEERLEHDGWIVPGQSDDLGVSEIIEDNHLHGEWSGAHLDALIHGVSYGVVGAGEAGEPDPLITFESPMNMVALWDRRRRRFTEALLVTFDERTSQPTGATLWLGASKVEMAHDGGWRILSRDQNRIGFPPVARLANRRRLADQRGRSEMSLAIRGYTDMAVRSLLGMEIAREFFAAPMLWLLGAGEEQFRDADGNPVPAWETYIGRIKALDFGEEGQVPDVKHFPGQGPAPFIEGIRGLAQMVAGEAGMPTSYLGLLTENPPSADSVRALESRLIKRAERRHSTFGPQEGWLMRLAIWVRDGADPGVTPIPLWCDPATPTRSAIADETQKLVQSGVLPPESEVTQRRVGLSEADRAQLAADRRRERMTDTLTALSSAAGLAESGDA